MDLDPNSDVFDAFLGTRHGKFMVGAVSFAIGIALFCIRRRVTLHSVNAWKNQDNVTKYDAVIRQEVLLLFGSVALMMGTVYLVWSLFPE